LPLPSKWLILPRGVCRCGSSFLIAVADLYFYLAKIPIPLIWTSAVQSPELSAVRGTIHFVLFLVCLYFGWFFRAKHRAN
jgi:hypothetical protein